MNIPCKIIDASGNVASTAYAGSYVNQDAIGEENVIHGSTIIDNSKPIFIVGKINGFHVVRYTSDLNRIVQLGFPDRNIRIIDKKLYLKERLKLFKL